MAHDLGPGLRISVFKSRDTRELNGRRRAELAIEPLELVLDRLNRKPRILAALLRRLTFGFVQCELSMLMRVALGVEVGHQFEERRELAFEVLPFLRAGKAGLDLALEAPDAFLAGGDLV